MCSRTIFYFTFYLRPNTPKTYILYHILASVPPVSSQSDDLYNPFSTTSCYSYSVNEPKRVGGGPRAMALNDINVKELCWKKQSTYKRKRIIFQVLRREGRHQPCACIRVWPRRSGWNEMQYFENDFASFGSTVSSKQSLRVYISVAHHTTNSQDSLSHFLGGSMRNLLNV